MSLKEWLIKVFVPDETIEREPFVFTEHMRIVIAILIVILGAGVIWWILV